MIRVLAYIYLIASFLVVVSQAGAGDASCHLQSADTLVCGKKKSEIHFNGTGIHYYLSEDHPEQMMGIFIREPSWAEGPDNQYYFILDYKRMIVFDDECLGGNFITIDKGDIVFSKYGEGDFTVFNPSKFESCKQPLSEWVKKTPRWNQ